ncbi:hypothetical protein [Variovorax sp. IB41]|uniref:hypothetical protein n=1 Tax=Variovorax sp. IB41 TaxID=2779370 RepID=UPI0018E904BD|nr:hypothetical protein [Variovorax sp. IB41]MBJ2156566.1 hypothetical protein [Variovorax sp. IB41]
MHMSRVFLLRFLRSGLSAIIFLVVPAIFLDGAQAQDGFLPAEKAFALNVQRAAAPGAPARRRTCAGISPRGTTSIAIAS